MATSAVSSPLRSSGETEFGLDFHPPGVDASLVANALARAPDTPPRIYSPEPSPPRLELPMPFPACLPDQDVYSQIGGMCAEYAIPLSHWPAKLPKEWGTCVKGVTERILFPLASKGRIHCYSDVRGYQYNQPMMPRIPGSYVWVGDRLWIMHQKPLPNFENGACPTLSSIYQSVINHRSHIICLASTSDTKLKRCSTYWETATFGISLCTSEELLQSGDQSLTRRCFNSNQGYSFEQIHLDHWQDKGCEPDLDILMRLFQEIDRLDGPLHMHCAAGINRTGTVAILYDIYKKLQTDPDPVINIPEIISTLRLMRPHICYASYGWLHKFIPLIAQRLHS